MLVTGLSLIGSVAVDGHIILDGALNLTVEIHMAANVNLELVMLTALRGPVRAS